jgi:hypothetical protein
MLPSKFTDDKAHAQTSTLHIFLFTIHTKMCKELEAYCTRQTARSPACNSVYVAIAGEVVNQRSELLRNFVLNGKESASNPLLHIHAKRYQPFPIFPQENNFFG